MLWHTAPTSPKSTGGFRGQSLNQNPEAKPVLLIQRSNSATCHNDLTQPHSFSQYHQGGLEQQKRSRSRATQLHSFSSGQKYLLENIEAPGLGSQLIAAENNRESPPAHRAKRRYGYPPFDSSHTRKAMGGKEL